MTVPPPPPSLSTVAPTPATPSATPKHSYDDGDREKNVKSLRPALWILGGAIAGLAAIATLLLRAGRPAQGQTRQH